MNESKIRNIISFLNQKKSLFEDYECKSKLAIDCDIEQINELLDKRTAISLKIDDLNEKIHEISNMDRTNNIKSALKNSCQRDELQSDYHEIFDISQSIFAIGNRIKNINDELEYRFIKLREEALDNIKKLNTSNIAGAAKYYETSTGAADASKLHFSETIKTI